MFRFGELFSGAGGLSLGLIRSGMQSVWAVDSSEDACATYQSMIGGHVICSKVEDVDFSALAEVAGLAFGFPCNDFSLVNNRKGTVGYFGGLYVYAEQALRMFKPVWFVAENVPGMMSVGGDSILKRFADCG